MVIPKYKELSEKIERHIFDRKLTGRLPGVRQLACRFEVNKITVNKALWLLEQKGILAIDGARGTYINANYTNRPRYNVIGIVGMNDNHVNNRFLEWLNRKHEALGYKLMGFFCPWELWHKDLDLLLKFPVDGYIFLGSYADEKTLLLLHENRIPAIASIFFDFPWLDRATYDHAQGYASAIRYLKSLGHRRIGFVDLYRPPEYRLYLDTIRKTFIQVQEADFREELFHVISEEFINSLDRYSPHFSCRLAEETVKYFMNRAEPPTAIIGTNSVLKHCPRLLRAFHRRVPDDISLMVVGCSLECTPGYTALTAREDDLLSWAVRRMALILEGKVLPRELYASRMRLRPGKSVAENRQTRMEKTVF